MALEKKLDSMQEGWTLLKRTGSAWLDDYAPSMGAALSYYTVFSLAPLLLIVISIAGLAFGEDSARGEIFGQLRRPGERPRPPSWQSGFAPAC